MPTSRKSPRRKSVSQNIPVQAKAQKLRRINDEELSQGTTSNRFRYLAVFLILIATATGGLFVFKDKLPFKASLPGKITSIISQEPSPKPQSTQEAKLTQVYEKEKNITLKNFTPRYSVYEDASVGFNPIVQDYGVKITPANGIGSIDVYASNGNSKIQVNTAGASTKDADILNTAADFIRGTFQFTQTQILDKKALQQRFGGANTSSHY